jgi:hypothetical protein
MTVCRSDDGTIVLEGDCPIEDAETFLELLHSRAGPIVDWTGCRHLHTAVVQLVLAVRPVLVGPCGDAFVHDWIEPCLDEP